jgi:tetratricopeptide (TPR) repeat protein
LAVIAVSLPTKVSAQEFTRQRLLVHNFEGRGDAGRKAADVVEDVVGRGKGRELEIISRWEMLQELQKAGFNSDSVLLATEIRDISRRHRADEYIVGKVVNGQGRAVRLEGALMLTRDSGLKQPIVTAELPDLGKAAEAFGLEVTRSRLQLNPLRRCENAMRAGKPAQAASAAQEGIKAYPRATLARVCLFRAVAAQNLPADSLLSVAQAVLAVDSTSWYAWEAAAAAYDELNNHEGAGKAWTKVAQLQSNDGEFVGRVVTTLMRNGNASFAKPIITKATNEHPEDEHLAGLHWRVLLATEEWAAAAKVGESLRKMSATYETQPDYFAKLATAYRNANDPFHAIARAAEGVSLHPEDVDLYLLYTQLVTGDAEIAMQRGLERFPKSGKLLALDAQNKKKKGDLKGALESTRRAVTSDSTLARGFLQLAQAYIDMGQPDSALAILEGGIHSAGDTAIVSQFALARGNALYRTANVNKKRSEFETALHYLQLAQRLAPSPNAGFLMGSAAFGVAQLAATELPTSKSCSIASVAQDNLVLAETQLTTNGAVAPDAAKQFLDYAAQLRPYVQQQVRVLCPAGTVGTPVGATATQVQAPIKP